MKTILLSLIIIFSGLITTYFIIDNRSNTASISRSIETEYGNFDLFFCANYSITGEHVQNVSRDMYMSTPGPDYYGQNITFESALNIKSFRQEVYFNFSFIVPNQFARSLGVFLYSDEHCDENISIYVNEAEPIQIIWPSHDSNYQSISIQPYSYYNQNVPTFGIKRNIFNVTIVQYQMYFSNPFYKPFHISLAGFTFVTGYSYAELHSNYTIG
jgi:hypothetical protein